ncbi:MAG: ABC transporter ATP-binding protein [Planctomycetes bacterium]|nr:ABC transporter ATP-binding protein [Planctomycetota bacterium]
MKTVRFIFPLARPYFWYYLAGIILIPPSTYCALAIPRYTGAAVDGLRAGPSGSGAVPAALIGALLLFALGRAVCLFGTRWLIIGASRRFEFDLRNRLFDHLQHLDRRFYDQARTGDLMNRSSTDIDAVRTMAGPCVMYSISTLFMLSLALPLMAAVDGLLTALLLVPLSLLTAAVRLIGPRVQLSHRRAQETLSALSSFAQENFGGMRVVKSFAMEEREIGAFKDLCEVYYQRSLATERVYNYMGPIAGAVGEIAAILLLLAGGGMILSGSFTLGDFIKFGGYQSLLIWPMISIGWVVNQVHRGLASVARLEEVFAARPAVADSGGKSEGGGLAAAVKPEELRGEIEFRRLNFSFNGPPVLQDLSLKIPAGKTVAILGRTGSGKSILASLIARLYAVPDGTLFIDGIDINRIPLASLRQAIGFVAQETFLFSRSIAENIAFGALDRDPLRWKEKASRLAALSRLDKDIDQFPHGYDEIVGERGVTLSGGQKQRVAIARAMMGRPRLLILDDALSAVDSHTEEEILHNLRQAKGDLTVLVISHRIASIKDADHIYVLEEGRIAEEGSHQELARRGGIYTEIFRMQLLAQELEEM